MDAEKALGRGSAEISSVVGYAGGLKSGPDGKVCYYYSDPRTVYERLGHAEVVKVDIASPDPAEIRKEFKSFAKTYFGQFRKTPLGMQRLVGVESYFMTAACLCLTRLQICPQTPMDMASSAVSHYYRTRKTLARATVT